jgi:hypothetical protein
MRLVFYLKASQLKYRGLHCIFFRIYSVAVLFVEFIFGRIFHKLVGIKFRIFWWMFMRFTYVGNKLSLPWFYNPKSTSQEGIVYNFLLWASRFHRNLVSNKRNSYAIPKNKFKYVSKYLNLILKEGRISVKMEILQQNGRAKTKSHWTRRKRLQFHTLFGVRSPFCTFNQKPTALSAANGCTVFVGVNLPKESNFRSMLGSNFLHKTLGPNFYLGSCRRKEEKYNFVHICSTNFNVKNHIALLFSILGYWNKST